MSRWVAPESAQPAATKVVYCTLLGRRADRTGVLHAAFGKRSFPIVHLYANLGHSPRAMHARGRSGGPARPSRHWTISFIYTPQADVLTRFAKNSTVATALAAQACDGPWSHGFPESLRLAHPTHVCWPSKAGLHLPGVQPCIAVTQVWQPGAVTAEHWHQRYIAIHLLSLLRVLDLGMRAGIAIARHACRHAYTRSCRMRSSYGHRACVIVSAVCVVVTESSEGQLTLKGVHMVRSPVAW